MADAKLPADRYSADTLTILPSDETDVPVGELNDILQKEGLDRPISAPGRTTGRRRILTVDGGRAVAAFDVLTGSGVDVRLDRVHVSGFAFMGKHWGHGFTWSEVSMRAEDRPVAPPWEKPAPGLRRPVIALLDTGVEHHPWIAVGTADDPFVIHAEESDFPRRFERTTPVHPPGEGPGRDAGHATFIAGLIRSAAPGARVLSMQVMDDKGKVRESRILEALAWLREYAAIGEFAGGPARPVDVVCMAFGREPDDPDPFEEVEAAMKPFAEAGIPLVASAGNDHQDREVLPAASASVIAVGAGFGRYHADFSNFGPWVDRYRDGVDVFGILPGTASDGTDGRWVKWSGTSFAAATFAADLARPQVDRGHV